MLSYILSFFKSKVNVLLLSLIIIIAILAGYNISQKMKISLLNSEVAVLKVEKEKLNLSLNISEESNKELRKSINLQNIYVDNLRKEAEKKLNESALLLNKAKIEAFKSKKRADQLMNAKPPENMTLCEAADKLINDEIENMRINNTDVSLNAEILNIP